MLEIGIFGEPPFSFNSMPARTYYTEWATFPVLACSCLIVACSYPTIGGEVAQPPRAMHTAMPRTIIIIPVSDAGVYNLDL